MNPLEAAAYLRGSLDAIGACEPMCAGAIYARAAKRLAANGFHLPSIGPVDTLVAFARCEINITRAIDDMKAEVPR